MTKPPDALDQFEQNFRAFTQAHPAPTHLCWFGTPWDCGDLIVALTNTGGATIAEAPPLVNPPPDTRPMEQRLDLRPHGVRKTFMGMYRGVLIFETQAGGGFAWADVDAEGTT